MTEVAPTPGQLAKGGLRFLNLDRMSPPNLDPAFLNRVGLRIIETFQIARIDRLLRPLFAEAIEDADKEAPATIGASKLSIVLGAFRQAAEAH